LFKRHPSIWRSHLIYIGLKLQIACIIYWYKALIIIVIHLRMPSLIYTLMVTIGLRSHLTLSVHKVVVVQLICCLSADSWLSTYLGILIKKFGKFRLSFLTRVRGWKNKIFVNNFLFRTLVTIWIITVWIITIWIVAASFRRPCRHLITDVPLGLFLSFLVSINFNGVVKFVRAQRIVDFLLIKFITFDLILSIFLMS
jgi:hypothetical protein